MGTIQSLKSESTAVSPELMRAVKKRFGFENYPDRYFQVDITPLLGNNMEATMKIKVKADEINKDIKELEENIEELKRLKNIGAKEGSMPAEALK